MNKLTLTIATLLLLLLSFPVFAAEDEDELPVVPYITTSGTVEQFNIPIPAGWQSIGSSQVPHLSNEAVEGDIYVIAVAADVEETGTISALSLIIEDFSAEPLTLGELNLDGNLWVQRTYRLEDDSNLTAFSLLRNSVVYVLAYLDTDPASDFYMIATRPDEPELQTGIQAAVRQLYPEIAEPASTDTVELSNGLWTRNTYTVEGSELRVLGQLRGNTIFTVIENGTGQNLDNANKAFYTVLFGFFVTPDSGNYLLLGLASIAVLLGLSLISMGIRYRNLQKDADLIEQIRSA